MTFKECLSITHPQFAGAHQHDCQEFLALLLDTMHEELRTLKGNMLITHCENLNFRSFLLLRFYVKLILGILLQEQSVPFECIKGSKL